MMEKYRMLVNTILTSDSEYANDDVEMLHTEMEYFVEYVKCVYRMEMRMRTIMIRLEGAERTEAIRQLDTSRRMAHERAISACSTINRLADMYHASHLCPDTDDRYVIADFCAAITMVFFVTGQPVPETTIDTIVSALEAGTIKIGERKEV